jgi:predicted Zn-dependent protease with MMP-like domain
MGMAVDEVNPEDLEIADELIAERRAEAPGETPEDMTPWQRPITAAIDVINYRVGQIIALLMVPLLHKMLFVSRELLPKISAADGPPRRDLVNT